MILFCESFNLTDREMEFKIEFLNKKRTINKRG